MVLIGGDRPSYSILQYINLFKDDRPEEQYLNPLYGFIWASCNIAGNYFNYSLNLPVPPNEKGALKIDNEYCDIIGSLIRRLFNKIPPGLEIRPSDPEKVDYMPYFTPKEFGIVIGLIYNIIIKPHSNIPIVKKKKSVIKPTSNKKSKNAFKEFSENKVNKLYEILKTDPDFLDKQYNNNSITEIRHSTQQFNKVIWAKLMDKYKKKHPSEHTVVEKPYFTIVLPDDLKGKSDFAKNVDKLNTCFKTAKTPNTSVILSNKEKGTAILHDIINVLLAVMWWNVDNLDGIKAYYTGLKHVVTSLSDLEIPDEMPPVTENSFTDTYIRLYTSLITTGVRLFDTGSSLLTDGKTTYSDCGETAVRNLLNICFIKANNEDIDIDKLKEIGVKEELLNYYKKYSTISSQSSGDARNAWSEVVSNLDEVNYVNISGDYKYNINAGLDVAGTMPNILKVVCTLFNKKELKWSDLTELNLLSTVDVKVDPNGIGYVMLNKEESVYKLHMMSFHFYIEEIKPSHARDFNDKLTSFTIMQKVYINGLLQKKLKELLAATENWLYYIYSIGNEYLYAIILKVINENINASGIKYNTLSANRYVAMLNYFTYFESDVYERITLNFKLLHNANFNGYDLSKYGILFAANEKNKIYDNIQSWTFGYGFNNGGEPLTAESLPKNLQSLTFGYSFNNGSKPLTSDALPKNLQSLTFGYSFDNGSKPLTSDALPENLQSLTFNAYFNNGDKPLTADSLPENLQSLTFGSKFNNGNEPLTEDVLPKNLKSLTFGNKFNNGNKPWTARSLPKKLKELTFDFEFTNNNTKLEPGVLPPELENLTLKGFSMKGLPFDKGALPKSLKFLYIPATYFIPGTTTISEQTLYVYNFIEIIPPNPKIKQKIIKLESQNKKNVTVGGFTKRRRQMHKCYKTKKNNVRTKRT